jgi:uncharacterized membrane protein
MATQRALDKEGAASLGPVDLVVLEFPGNRFSGAGLRELHQLVVAGTINIIDLVIVTKNEAGQVAAMDLHDLAPDASAALVGLQATISQMLTQDDIEAVGEQLSNNSTAALLLYENTWAAKVKQAIIEANGRVVVQARIPHEIIQATIEDLVDLGA